MEKRDLSLSRDEQKQNLKPRQLSSKQKYQLPRNQSLDKHTSDLIQQVVEKFGSP